MEGRALFSVVKQNFAKASTTAQCWFYVFYENAHRLAISLKSGHNHASMFLREVFPIQSVIITSIGVFQ